MKHWLKITIFLVVMTTVLSIGAWFFAKQSASFDVAKSFVKTNPQIQSQIGSVNTISLPFFGYSIKRTGGSGEASFTLKLTGVNGNATVNTQLAYQGSWRVTSAILITSTGPIRLQILD